MRKLKFILSITILSFLFFGSVGLSAYKHICDDNDVLITVYTSESTEHCNDHENEHCSSQPEGVNDCCSDEFAYFQLKFDFFDQLKTFQFTPLAIVNYNFEFYINVIVEQSEIDFPSYANPPPLKNSTRLNLYQSYLI